MNNSQGVQDKTKNDIAWERLFQQYSILEFISQKGIFEIDSALISSCNLDIKDSTIGRRARTVRRWVEWILNVISD
ncbi:MAG TPA: hypothetical protein DEV81_18950 [Cyanobacteria bacterium UBA11049]|nr:hypothetical protein [Cyanobacteria bacterium UBA11049]